ncbi:VOC family protein [Dehalogenimonas etheniformans]|uniref:VOC family protein n=2 Tax=Dehalogenimonas etheniformans TaxID=1536648 RepID=A0A2P5P7Q4_9CHLR|nr:VOC family protein [Dehalogenimonas etheniformans]PPD58327.1 VOC family protein [Dehalogenimonas etheniformans]QNT77087.1 VOC family protein [Dehalogenimonas etheniformans]
MNRVIHFEIPAIKADRAVKFYETVFGWKIEKWAGPMDYWNITTGADKEPGINGAIMSVDGAIKQVVNTIGVKNLDEAAKKVLAAGGKRVSPDQTVPGIGYFAYFTDTEGNPFGLMQNDPKAK